MEYASIERELRIDASPEIVFEVVSDPVHVTRWWPEEADYEVEEGSAGELVFVHEGERITVAFEVVDAVPGRLFSFRWTHPEGERPRRDNSFLVTFELSPDGDGTLLRMTETGFRERGWEVAVLEAAYRDHSEGWDHHLARLAPYVATYVAAGAAR
ncbi:MAG TPA: SRPBCC domain-containing protein [Nocardioides sp.]|nr:SRPBCC domain-containing protein [Nocardioides sp.]